MVSARGGIVEGKVVTANGYRVWGTKFLKIDAKMMAAQIPVNIY